MTESIASRPAGRADVVRRALVTAALVLASRALAWVPLPFVGPTVDLGLAAHRLSVRELGLGALVEAFILVELVALAIPRLQRRRHGTAADRAGLTRAAWILGMAFAGAQAYGLVHAFDGWSIAAPWGGPLLENGTLPHLAAGLSLVAGTALLGGLAMTISRHGLGNGLAVLVASEVGFPLAAAVPGLLAGGGPLAGAPLRALLFLAVLGLPIALLARVARPRRVAPVPAPTSGLVPVTWAANLWLLPAVAAAVTGARAWSGSEAWTRYAAAGQLVLAVALTLPLAVLFTHRRSVEASWRAVGPGAPAPEEVRSSLRSAHRVSLLLVAAVGAVPIVLAAWFGLTTAASALFGLSLLVATTLDVIEEARARARHGPLVSAYPLQRVHAAAPALAALAAAGVPAATRALRYRVLEQFFAPFAPVEILVPPDRAEEAAAICARVARAPDAAPPPAPSST